MNIMDKQRVKFPEVLFFQEGPGVRNTQYTNEGVKLLNVANLVDGSIDLSTSDRYISTNEAFGKYKHFLCDEGDFIVASSGIKVEYIDKKMGFVTKEMLPLCMNTSTIRFKPLDKNILNIRYFMYFLKSNDFKQQLSRHITGSAQLNYGPSHLKIMTMPLVSIEKQVAIVNKLDKTVKLLQIRNKQLQKFDNLIKARFVEMFGDCKTNPKAWNTVELGNIASVGSSKRVFVDQLKNEGVPFYRGTEVGALAEGKRIIPELFITPEHYAELIDFSGKPSVGDLLMPSICPDGRIWVVNTEEPFYFKDGRVLWVHSICKDYDPVFLLYTLKDRIMTDYNSIASGTTFAELKIFTLRQCHIFNVPINLQREFVAFIHQIDKSKVAVQKSLEQTQMLFDSLMQQYFG